MTYVSPAHSRLQQQPTNPFVRGETTPVALAIGGGGALAAAGAAMPWASLRLGLDVVGIQSYYGVACLFGGVVVLVLAFMLYGRAEPARVVCAVTAAAGAAGLVVVGYVLAEASDVLGDDVPESGVAAADDPFSAAFAELFAVTPGYGLYVVGLGCLLVLAGSIRALTRTS